MTCTPPSPSFLICKMGLRNGRHGALVELS